MVKKSTKFRNCLFRHLSETFSFYEIVSRNFQFVQTVTAPSFIFLFLGSSHRPITADFFFVSFFGPYLVRFYFRDHHCHQDTRGTVATPSPHGCTLCAFCLVPHLSQVQTYNSKDLCLASVCFVALAASRAVEHHDLVAADRSLLRSLMVEQSLMLDPGLRNMQICEMGRSLVEVWHSQGVVRLRFPGMDSSGQSPWGWCTSWHLRLPGTLSSRLLNTWICQKLDVLLAPHVAELASESAL